MGCNCNKATVPQGFIYISPGGTMKEYRTEVEARAAVIRNGGGHYTAK